MIPTGLTIIENETLLNKYYIMDAYTNMSMDLEVPCQTEFYCCVRICVVIVHVRLLQPITLQQNIIC